MAEIQLFYIGTSKAKEIRMSGVPTYNWGSTGKWTKFKEPVANASKKVAYNKTAKSGHGATKYGGLGGVTKLGTTIPARAQKMIGGVSVTVDVRYYQRGYTIIKRTAALTRQKKMLKTTYTKDKPYQYQLQYKDKVTYSKSYSTYVNGTEYIYFADHYYNDSGTRVNTNGHLPHPSSISFSFADVRRNFESNANNNDNRDNKGKYVMSNVRSNVLTMNMTWTGLSGDDGSDLLDTLNPDNGQNYLIVQYLDPVKQKAKNGTFFAAARNVEKYPNGVFKEISVTLTEV